MGLDYFEMVVGCVVLGVNMIYFMDFREFFWVEVKSISKFGCEFFCLFYFLLFRKVFSVKN